jgi:hypothetical protein
MDSETIFGESCVFLLACNLIAIYIAEMYRVTLEDIDDGSEPKDAHMELFRRYAEEKIEQENRNLSTDKIGMIMLPLLAKLDFTAGAMYDSWQLVMKRKKQKLNAPVEPDLSINAPVEPDLSINAPVEPSTDDLVKSVLSHWKKTDPLPGLCPKGDGKEQCSNLCLNGYNDCDDSWDEPCTKCGDTNLWVSSCRQICGHNAHGDPCPGCGALVLTDEFNELEGYNQFNEQVDYNEDAPHCVKCDSQLS